MDDERKLKQLLNTKPYVYGYDTQGGDAAFITTDRELALSFANSLNQKFQETDYAEPVNKAWRGFKDVPSNATRPIVSEIYKYTPKDSFGQPVYQIRVDGREFISGDIDFMFYSNGRYPIPSLENGLKDIHEQMVQDVGEKNAEFIRLDPVIVSQQIADEKLYSPTRIVRKAALRHILPTLDLPVGLASDIRAEPQHPAISDFISKTDELNYLLSDEATLAPSSPAVLCEFEEDIYQIEAISTNTQVARNL